MTKISRIARDVPTGALRCRPPAETVLVRRAATLASGLALLVSIAARAGADDAGASRPGSVCDSWFDFVYRKLGMGCPDEAMTVFRGQSERPMGSALVELDPATGMERTLWECGACNSPVRYRSGVAVATPSGIAWVDAAGGHPLLSVPNVVRLLGAPRDAPDTLLLVVSSGAGKPLSISLADPSHHEVHVTADVPPGEGVPPLIPDQLREDGAVVEAHTEAGRAPLVRQGKAGRRSVSPVLDRKQDLFFRLDPIWSRGGKVIYVKRSL